MSEFVYLIGAEDVLKAGYEMRNAAQEMTRAANQIHDDLHRFLEQFAEIVASTTVSDDLEET